MVKKEEFIKKFLKKIEKQLKESLPEEDTLGDMYRKTKDILCMELNI
jgi:hypothetical protein